MMEIHTPAEVVRWGSEGSDEAAMLQLLQGHASEARKFVVSIQLEAELCLRVLGCLDSMNRLTHLSLTNQALSFDSVAIIGDALRATPLAAPLPVSTLALESCGISDEDGAMLFEKIRDNPYIEKLFLSGNELGVESCQALAECMAMHSSNAFRVVQLGYNAITPECVTALQGSISRHRLLNSLSLHGNLQLSDSGCAILCDSLRTDTLQVLNLAGINLRGTDVTPLTQLIQESVVLVELILAQNYLPDEAIAVLAASLEESASLRSLDLSYNCFGKGESTALGECLVTNKTMIHLSLAGNLLSSKTVEAIAVGIEKNHTLTSLDLSRCCLNDDNLRALQKGILNNDTLQEIQCGGNNWCAAGSEQIEAALSSADRHMKSQLDMLFAMVDWNKTRGREMHADQLAAGLADSIPPPPDASPISQPTKQRKTARATANTGTRRMSFVETIKRQVQRTSEFSP